MKKLKHTSGPYRVGEGEFSDQVFAVPLIPKKSNEWDEALIWECAGNKGNAELSALAPTAPHHCADPLCPGDINRRKLEIHEALIGYLRALTLHLEEREDYIVEDGKKERNAYSGAKAIIQKAEAIK